MTTLLHRLAALPLSQIPSTRRLAGGDNPIAGTPQDFVVELGAYRLKQEKRNVFFTKFEERLSEEIHHPLFDYNTTYRRCLELQARLLAKYLTGDIDVYPPQHIR